MSTTARIVRYGSLVPGTPGTDELVQWGFEKVAADPATPANGQEWLNTADARRRVRIGTNTRTYAFLTDIVGVWKARGTHSTAVLPTAASATVDPGVALENYNTFLMTNAADVTITGIQGSDVLSAGDVLILINAAAPTVAASWVGIQRNMTETNFLIGENLTVASVPADTATVATMTTLANIQAYDIEDSTGVDIKGSVVARRSAANAITITSSVALSNIVIRAVGAA